MTRKKLLPIFAVIGLIMAILGALSFNTGNFVGKADVSTEKTFLINSKELSYYGPTATVEEGLWKADEYSSGYVGKWDYAVISPSGSGAISIVFTAPKDATLSGIIVSAYNLHPVTEEYKNDGARIALFKNNQKIYPSGDSLFESVSNDNLNPTVIESISDISLDAGDKLYFIAENGGKGNNGYDAVVYDFSCTYQDTETAPTALSLTQNVSYKTDSSEDLNAPSGIGSYTKSELISYAFVEVLASVDMEVAVENQTEVVLINKTQLNWSEKYKFWCPSDTEVFPYIYHASSGEELVPGNYSTIAIEFTAPTDGTISNKFGLGSFRKHNEKHGTSDDKENDLARFTVVKGNKVIYPSQDIWETVPFADEEFKNIQFNSFEIKAGEKIYYIVDNGGNTNNSYDNVLLKDVGFLWIDEDNPDGVWFNFYENYYTTDTEEQSSIAGYKKSEVIAYLGISSVEPPVPEAVEITKKSVTPIKNSLISEIPFNTQHTQLSIRSAPNLLVRADCVQPCELYMLALEWTAPKDGRVRISSSFVNNFLYKTEEEITDISVSDGVRVKVLLNNEYQIFPTGEKEWETTRATDNLYIDVDTFAVKQGDKILFILDCNKKEQFDTSSLQLIYDFAEEGSGFTERYNSYEATAKMFATPDGSLDGTPWEYFAIALESDAQRYFGGNTYELPLVPIVVSNYTGIIIIGVVGLVVVGGGATTTVVIIKKRRSK